MVTKIKRKARIIKKSVSLKTAFECSINFFFSLLRNLSFMSMSTINPSPPVIMSKIAVMFTMKLPLNAVRLVGKVEKPALQKADTL